MPGDKKKTRDVLGQHSFLADPDPAVFLNVDPDPNPDADPDPALKNCSMTLYFVKIYVMKSWLLLTSTNNWVQFLIEL